MEIIDAYVTTAPSSQSVVDIFEGEWSSSFPGKSGLAAKPGGIPLFEDSRITWLSDLVGGFGGKRILELGPLEAGHTYMMHEGGAHSITSVEANSRAYLKCLCVKEVFGLARARFLYGEAFEYTTVCEEQFDLCVASGILYHTNRPIEFLQNICRTSNLLFLWTHYYDEAPLKLLGSFSQFGAPITIESQGNQYTAARRKYGEALKWAGFCGGGAESALWLTRESLFRALSDCGFAVEAIGFDAPDHPNGPALAVAARKKH